LKEVRYSEPGSGRELIIRFDEESRWQVGTGTNGQDFGDWVVIDPEIAPAPVATAISDLFHAVRANPTHS
jgi:hypothetical protein